MCIEILIAELYGMQLCAGDIGNVYLEVHTKEKVGRFAGPEFGELACHMLLIFKCLYAKVMVQATVRNSLTLYGKFYVSPLRLTRMFEFMTIANLTSIYVCGLTTHCTLGKIQLGYQGIDGQQVEGCWSSNISSCGRLQVCEETIRCSYVGFDNLR